MLSFGKAIIEFFLGIWDIVTNIIGSLIFGLQYIMASTDFITQAFTFFPSFLGGAFLVFISIYVVRFLLLK